MAQEKGYAVVRDLETLVTNMMSDQKVFHGAAFKYRAFLEYLEYDLFHIPTENDDHYGIGE